MLGSGHTYWRFRQRLTNTLHVWVAFETWWAHTSKTTGKIFTESSNATRGARAFVLVATADARVAFIAGWTAALVAALHVATLSARAAAHFALAFIDINALRTK